jgi:hypothetical protein
MTDRARLALLALPCLWFVAGCASQEQIGKGIAEVNQAFQADYEALLSERGMRSYRVARPDAVVALQATLSKLGMSVTDVDADLGTLGAEAPAPKPLTASEWERAAAADLPRMRELVRKHVGLMAQFVRFEPEGLQIVIHATVAQWQGGVEVALTTRMRELSPPRSGIPRREYPPPSAVDIALGKIWSGFEAELRAAGKLR